MPFQLILGSSGSGKSYTLYKKIIQESIENPEENYIAIVPEQFSMETQKDIVSLHPQNGVMNIDIVSFGRLAYRVFEEVGASQLPILDDTGKNLILRKVMENQKRGLKLYASKMNTPGFVSEIKSVISEFYQYGIQEKQMEVMLQAAQNRPMLLAKLRDIDTIRRGFQKYIEEKYITKEEILDVLCDVLPKSEVIPKSVICLDGFTGFTPIQYKLIGLLMKLAKKVIITVTIDPREKTNVILGEQELFYTSKNMISHLLHIGEEIGAEQEESLVLKEGLPYRFRECVPLAMLETNLFRYPNQSYYKEQEAISIHAARNPRKEAEFIAREIWKLIREKKYRYRDIAVITGDMTKYADIVRDVFVEHSLPCFIDHKTSIMGNPFVEFLRSALEIIRDDFSYESVFRFLRSGMAGIERIDIDNLETYCIALGIRGNKKWQKQWVRSYKKGEALDLEYTNQLREKVLKSILPLWDVWKRKESTVREKMTALYQFVSEHQIQEKLFIYEEEFQNQKKLALAKEYKQTFRLVIELFDKVVELLGDEIISIKELTAILDSGFEEIKVGLIPPAIDQIVVGDMERTRLKNVKALFFMGVNDGIIPQNTSKGGILSQQERQALKESQVELSPTGKENAYTQRFYLYLNLTKPSEVLYLSYSRTSSEGNAIRPSYFIGTIKKIFPKIQEIDEEINCVPMNYITTPEGALSYWLEGLEGFGQNRKKEMREWEELYSWYLKSSDWKERIKLLVNAAFYENKESGIGKLAASSLYGPQAFNSVTRLEKYAACAFAHFLIYGLKLEKRKEYELLSIDLGNMFHNTIERYSKKLKEQHLSFAEIKEEERKKLVKESLEEAATDYGNNILQSNARNSYLLERLERISDRTAWALGEQLKRGDFTPVDYEVSFTEADELEALTFPLEDGNDMKLKGRIDRMDLYEDEENIYVKIIDYKSGNTTFDLSSVYYGLQMQLVVYLDAAVEAEKKKHPDKMVIPAGIFYYNIKDPIIEIEAPDTTEKEIGDLILKELRMNGLVNEKEEIISLMDKTMEKKSDVIPVAYNNDGSVAKTSSAVTEEQFQSLSSYVRKKIKNMGDEIFSGSTQINPYEKGQRRACDFCEYRFVCGFDERLSGYQYHRLRELKPEEVWSIIDEKEKQKKGEE